MFARAAYVSLFAALAMGVACAQDAPMQGGCDKHKWSVERELAWFAANPEPVSAGGELKGADRGYAVTLLAGDAAGFVVAPERAPKAGTFGGVFKIALDKPGAYEVTLSAEAWVDVAQNGARMKSIAFSGQKNCPGVRKSVKFALAAGATSLQISNADSDKLMLAIAPAP